MTKVELELLTDIGMLLMIEKKVEVEFVKQYIDMLKQIIDMKNYDKDIISSYLMYLDASNLCGWAMSQKLPINGFKWVEKSRLSKFNQIFIKNYDESSDKGYFIEVDVDYPKKLFGLHKDLSVLPKRKKVNKIEKLVCNIEDKEKYVMHIKVLTQALNHG